jgi:hypothetical protein
MGMGQWNTLYCAWNSVCAVLHRHTLAELVRIRLCTVTLVEMPLVDW